MDKARLQTVCIDIERSRYINDLKLEPVDKLLMRYLQLLHIFHYLIFIQGSKAPGKALQKINF